MRLTDATQLRLIAGNTRIAVTEGRNPAVILKLDAENVFPCTWLIEGRDEDGICYHDCGAPTVAFDNGFCCLNGHDHYTYGGDTHAEYYERDEMEHAYRAGTLSPNARLV